ncbi:MAG TPA: MlaD family protein [Coxiellaceae bacterium]|nr:MlaD family protein [Coxiellaceae bacterium]
MEGKVNYTVVGIFVVFLSAMLFAVIFWLSAGDHGKLYNNYVVFVHEDVTGLSVESPVRFNGVKVGYVESMSLDKTNSKLVRLLLRIEPGVPITTSTYAILNAQGVTGVIYVNLKSTTETAPPLTIRPGQDYPVIPAHPSFLTQLNEVLPEVANDIQKLSASVAQVLDEQNRASIQKSLKNIANITQMMSNNSADFTETMRSLDNTLANVSEASNQFPKAVTHLNQTLASINTLSTNMTQTSQTINATMQSGQQVIHNFSDQVMPAAQQALSNLAATTQSAHVLMEQLQRDPSMLVRGKQPEPLGPGEK